MPQPLAAEIINLSFCNIVIGALKLPDGKLVDNQSYYSIARKFSPG